MTVAAGTARWIVVPRPNPQAARRLLCCAHAGAGMAAFRQWPGMLSSVEICVVSLPGRGSRFRDPPVEQWREVLQPLTAAWKEFLDRPYSIFGHSFGGHLAFELTRELRRAGHPLPNHLFVSACRAPHLDRRHSALHHLPDRQFIEAVGTRYDSVPDAVVQSAELLALTLPALRADLRLFETYQFRSESPLACAISAYCGSADPTVLPDEMAEWALQTSGPFELEIVAGGHLFYASNPPQLLDSLRRQLESMGRPTP